MTKTIQTTDLKKLPQEYQVRFALFCAKQVIHLTENPEAKACIKTIENYLLGKASAKDCRKAADAAYAAGAGVVVHAAGAAAYYAAGTGVGQAGRYAADYYAAVYAGAVEAKVIEDQWVYYNELLNIDSIILGSKP